MFERLEAIKERNDAITKELTKPEVISDVKKVTKLSKEQSDLSEIIECYDAYLKANCFPTSTSGSSSSCCKAYPKRMVILLVRRYNRPQTIRSCFLCTT